MGAFRICILVVVLAMPFNAIAQAPAPLPKSMSGRWVVALPNGRLYTDTASVVLDAPEGTGSVTGRFTSRGVACGALDEPLVGTWDGTELRFDSRVGPIVNADQNDGQCVPERSPTSVTLSP